jgi:predicted phosphodiesterase
MEDVEASGAEVTLHAGDVVGYNPYPNEVIDLLRSGSIRSIRGNHDRAVVTGDTTWFNPYAAEAVEWTRRELSEPSMGYLRSLPSSMEVRAGDLLVRVFHGSPRDEDEYVFPHEAGPHLLEEARCDVVVMGHTHVPYVMRTPRGMVLNAGSVGQPRDRDSRAAWVLLDTDGPRAELRRVEYDVSVVYDEILNRGLPQMLADRLLVGR